MTQGIMPAPAERSHWRLVRMSIIAAMLLLVDRAVDASGIEYLQQAWTLRVSLDSRWCGCGAGGYYPIRVRITNLGQSRELTLTVNRSASSGARIERRITLEQNETQFCSLSVPIISDENLLSFAIFEKGMQLPEFNAYCNIQRNDASRPSLLIVDRDVANRAAFENGANLVSAMWAGPTAYSHRGGRSEDSEVVSPTMLPDHWIDYSGLDILATSFATFKSLPVSIQNAVLNWIETGGNLILYEAPVDQSELDRALQVHDRAFAAAGWHSSDETFEAARHAKFENVGRANPGPIVATTEAPWPNSAGAIQQRNLQLGRVYLFATNPFPGSTEDWACWIDATGQDRLVWNRRTGVSSSNGQLDYYEFLVPGVGDVPIVAFLCIVTVFAIVIGPLNYWYFFRRQQLHLLLLTTPFIAVVTSTLLFVYAAASDGFGVRSRTTSLTFIDHRTESAVTLQRLCLFAGLAPFDGMRFTNETAIFSLHPPVDSPGPFSVDLTQGQHLTNGWLPSRMMSQYELVTRRKERARVEVTRSSTDSTLQFASGLPWNIKNLVLVDEDGQHYYAEDVKPGEAVKLRLLTLDDCKQVQAVALSARPVMPTGISEGWSRPRRYYYSEPQDTGPFMARAQRERILTSLYNANCAELSKPLVERRHYLAVLSEKPGLEQGLESIPSVKDLNILIGNY